MDYITYMRNKVIVIEGSKEVSYFVVVLESARLEVVVPPIEGPEDLSKLYMLVCACDKPKT